MEISVIKIGNSKGIRLSKSLLERYHITDQVELMLKNDCIILRPTINPRKGWKESFRKMSGNKDDKLLIDDVFQDETFGEWS